MALASSLFRGALRSLIHLCVLQALPFHHSHEVRTIKSAQIPSLDASARQPAIRSAGKYYILTHILES